MNALNVLFFVAALAVFVYVIIVSSGMTWNRKPLAAFTPKKRKSLLVLGAVLMFVSFGFKTIGSDYRGLRFTFGAIANEALQPGMHFNTPFIQSIKTVTVRPIEIEVDVPVDANGAITKDNQTIGSQMALFYVYDPDRLPTMWKDYGEEKLKSITTKSMVEAFKAQVGRYDIFILPTSQDSIRLKTLKQIKAMMAEYPLQITELKITNYDWSDDFDAQIKQTMNRSQEVKQKEQELLVAEQEAQKKVKTAEADKTAMVTTAEGKKIAAGLEADAKALEGEGIRKYNDAVAKNIEQELKFRELEIRKIEKEKWNGQYVPTNNYGPIPIETGSLLPRK